MISRKTTPSYSLHVKHPPIGSGNKTFSNIGTYASRLERVQSEGNELYVSKRNILQPAAQQVERVQIVEGEYGKNVLERRLLQPAAPRSLVRYFG